MINRRRILLAVLALFLAGVGYLAWTLAGLPPIKYYLRYGLEPYCEPTGERTTYEGVEFVEVGPGIFRMGSTHLAEGGDWLGKICAPLGLAWGTHPKPSDEMPVHWVEFRRGFWIATTEITNAQYEKFRPKHERNRWSKGDDTPVVQLTWYGAKEYCAWLSEKSGRPMRLPSEAEWECACRAGSDDEFTFGDDDALLAEYAQFWVGRSERPRAAGVGKPNRWGLFNLHGNVDEWCEDTWHDSYSRAPSDGSPWVSEADVRRVARGGNWMRNAAECRSAKRYRSRPDESYEFAGFRPAFSNPEEE